MKNIKIYLKVPNLQTRNKLKQWFGTARYVYNKGLASYQDEITSFIKLRNRFVNAKARAENGGTVNPEIKDWELETPKVIRAESLRDLSKNFNRLKKLKDSGQISHFTLHFKSKKDKKASIVINKQAPKFKNDGIILFQTLLPEVLKVGRATRKKWFGQDQKLLKLWNHQSDIRLVTDGYRYWINFPVKVEHKKGTNKGFVALDPGIRCFQTSYSTKEVAFCHEKRWDLVKKLRQKLDGLRQARSKGRITKCVFSRRYYKWARKLENRSDHLHWETISYLVGNYDSILLPHFESQEMRKNKLSRTLNRNFDYFRHYTFKCRLKEKCLEKEIDLFFVDEDYTSLTCGMCGRVKKKAELGTSKVYNCKKESGGCGVVLDRDVNGARNILIKNLKRKVKINLRHREKFLIKLKNK